MKSLLAAVATALLFAMPAFAQDPQVATLAASGNGAVEVTPDIAVVTLGVTSRAGTASAALAQNSTELTNALAAIRAGGVADKDIATSDFSIYPVTEQQDGQQTRPPKIIGYEVSNTVRVTIRDIASSGSLLDHVVSAGANRVSGIRFDVADRTSAEDEALKAAIADARKQAALMAEAAGVKLVRILSVSANSGGGPMPVFARAAAAPPVPVMPGQQSITANASITYEIAPQ